MEVPGFDSDRIDFSRLIFIVRRTQARRSTEERQQDLGTLLYLRAAPDRVQLGTVPKTSINACCDQVTLVIPAGFAGLLRYPC